MTHKSIFSISSFFRSFLSDESLVGTGRSHFRVRLNGIGVACGFGILLDQEGSLHGVPSNEAYHIGEDVCEDGVVLVTKNVYEKMKTSDRFSSEGVVICEDFCSEEEEEKKEGGATAATAATAVTAATAAVVYKKITVGTLPMEAELVSTNDLRYLPKQLGLFASRHNEQADITTIDQNIADQFQTKFTALMFHLDLETGAQEFGALQLIVLKGIKERRREEREIFFYFFFERIF